MQPQDADDAVIAAVVDEIVATFQRQGRRPFHLLPPLGDYEEVKELVARSFADARAIIEREGGDQRDRGFLAAHLLVNELRAGPAV
jgi:hypothetical protein